MTEELVAQLDHHISTSREQRNAAKRRATLKEELVAQLDHHISTSREQRNAAKRCATLKEELVAGDLPILAVPFTTAMLSLGKKQMITYKRSFC